MFLSCPLRDGGVDELAKNFAHRHRADPPELRVAGVPSWEALVVDNNSSDSTADIEPSTTPAERPAHIVVVDAGHGGPDFGMSGPIGSSHPIYEKDITLAVATKVAAALRGQRKLDQAKGLVPFACKLPDSLVDQLKERAASHPEGMNGLIAELLVNGLAAGV